MKENQEQIKNLFLEAIKLSSEEQKKFISTISNVNIREEVDSLVKNHVEDFTISIDYKPSKIQPTEKEAQLKSPAIFKLLFGNKYKLTSTLVFITLIILTVAIFTKSSVKQALVDVRHNELTNIIRSNQLTMTVWIEDQKKLISILSKAPKITSKINDLVYKYGFGKNGNPDTIWNDKTHHKLVEFLAPILASEGIPLFSVLDKTGYRVATNIRNDLGGQVNTEGLVYVSPVFNEEQIIFTRPTIHRLYENGSTSKSTKVPLTWIDAPVYDTTGKVIATLGLGYYANEGFSKFLNIQKAGQNGESFAFDKNGLLVSHSKHRNILQKSGILQKDQKSILNTVLRNPQTDLANCTSPPKNYASLPFIVPVANILAQKDSDSIIENIITEPYLNYIGQKVIGASVWLPNYNFGIVTEMPYSEAFLPLNRLTWIFAILLILLFSLAIYSTISTFSLFNIRKNTIEKIGPYFIKEKIGEGGMGEVYLAEHQLLKRPTAIKTLKKTLTGSQNQLRFEREVLLTSKLSHPNTIHIYDFGRTESDSFYFAMEFLEGINLSQLSNTCGVISPDRTLYILLQICYSLKEAHHKGLIHRDIKPQNIMICSLGDMYDVVKVLDFGLVKDIEDETKEELTTLFEIGGTPMYMSPERLVAPQTVDYSTDIYSVGVIAYFLLTAKKPFLLGVTKADIINQVINQKPLEMKVENLTEEFSDIIYRCMEKDPADRPADMNELIALLERLNTHTWTQQQAKIWWEENISGINFL